MSRPRIVIVGGGFSGAVVAVQLARKLEHPAMIDIVEPRAMLGGGVAYSATDPAHRINVPAARMTVFAEDPTQFDRWLRLAGVLQSDPAARWSDGSAFPQRAVFGRYIAGLVADAVMERPDIAIHHRRTQAIEIIPQKRGFTVVLEQGAPIAADLVVLAVSHPPPSLPGIFAGLIEAGGPVVADPWRAGALAGIAPEADILVVGTGLTMADVVASLEARGHRGRILAISRRGLLSRGHALPAPEAQKWFDCVTPPNTALSLSRMVRARVIAAREAGIPWQAVFDDVRANARRLWSALPLAEQRRLVRHLRPTWDVHRFRVAPQIEAAIARLAAAGQFSGMAASLVSARLKGGRVAVTLRPRGAGPSRVFTQLADAVVVTTGPAHGSALTVNPALASLAAQGLLRADPTGLGLDVDPFSRAIGDAGIRPDLFIAGPLARGRFGELMGLPQVSDHADSVATEATSFLARATPCLADAAANDAQQHSSVTFSPSLRVV